MENCDSEKTNINNNIILNDKELNDKKITIINLKSPLLKMIFSFLLNYLICKTLYYYSNNIYLKTYGTQIIY